MTAVDETREPVDPALVTGTLMPLVESLGRHESVAALRKTARDDVVWLDARFSWRRSPFWLVLRVICQCVLSTHVGGPKGRALYKFLMVVTLARLLKSGRTLALSDMAMLTMQKLCR